MSLNSLKSKCPGLYCGRQLLENVSISWNIECGACPRGYRVNSENVYSACEKCENNPSTYDWLYLGFMAMLPLILHWFFIDLAAKERWFVRMALFLLDVFVIVIFSLTLFSFTKGEIILHISAFFEVLLSAVITLLIYEPFWSLRIHSCSVSRLSDWYTLFHNPTPNYEKKLYCTQEAVYPLYV